MTHEGEPTILDLSDDMRSFVQGALPPSAIALGVKERLVRLMVANRNARHHSFFVVIDAFEEASKPHPQSRHRFLSAVDKLYEWRDNEGFSRGVLFAVVGVEGEQHVTRHLA